MLSTNRIAGFSDHKYLCKESININQNQSIKQYQSKVPSRLSFFEGCGQLYLLSIKIEEFFGVCLRTPACSKVKKSNLFLI